MKKLLRFSAVVALVVVLVAGCASKPGVPAVPELPPTTPSEAREIDLSTLLSDIESAVPGTAGSTLKQTRAAGELLDWAQSGATAQREDVEAWLAQSEVPPADMAYAWAAVLDAADRIVAGETGVDAELEDAGYVPAYESYDDVTYRAAARSLIPLFTGAIEKAAPYVPEEGTDWAGITADRLEGIWYDGVSGEMLVFSNGMCRVVVPMLDVSQDTPHAFRVRDRSAKDYCPALEIDTWDSGSFSGALTYYVSGLDDTQFWSNTQSQRFEKVPQNF